MAEAEAVLDTAEHFAKSFAETANRLVSMRLGRFDADAMLEKLWPDVGADCTKVRNAEARAMVLGIYDCSQSTAGPDLRKRVWLTALTSVERHDD